MSCQKNISFQVFYFFVLKIKRMHAQYFNNYLVKMTLLKHAYDE